MSDMESDIIEADICLKVPDESNDLDQKQAYQNFINVLSAILVKYAAEIDLDD